MLMEPCENCGVTNQLCVSRRAGCCANCEHYEVIQTPLDPKLLFLPR